MTQRTDWGAWNIKTMENEIMDYEKKYNEALEWMREIYPTMEGFVKEDAEHYFPELKENEDEKIRTRLIALVESFGQGAYKNEMLAYLEKQKDERELVFIEGKMEGVRQTCQEIKDAMSLFEPKDLTPFEFTFRDYIDSAIRYCLSGEGYQQYIKEWAADLLNLEKQEEQKPLMCDGEIEDRKRDIVAAIRKCYPADYAEYLTSFLKGLSPEDNSEDEYGQEMLGIAYKLMYEHIPENLRTQEFWDSLKFMREYTGKVAIIHSYEKSAEWSEEDDALLKEIVSFFKDGTVKLQHDLNLYAGFLEKKLKSLRPQPHWKPSDEQIGILGKVFAGCQLKDSERDSMVDLFYHLKDMI